MNPDMNHSDHLSSPSVNQLSTLHSISAMYVSSSVSSLELDLTLTRSFPFFLSMIEMHPQPLAKKDKSTLPILKQARRTTIA